MHAATTNLQLITGQEISHGRKISNDSLVGQNLEYDPLQCWLQSVLQHLHEQPSVDINFHGSFATKTQFEMSIISIIHTLCAQPLVNIFDALDIVQSHPKS
jgi:hypothetical protein